ncbi:NUDIX domain-containing protein [Shimazuella sp. AN120528]|uniref:NUDIX hydrolase n=1 Tax=Shimazuella soli TaxID=1892854 RepID=UPI001F0FA2EA|nr:NUDIX domain-containing protein [Shimazuella soli]MCH5586343.1 NUDIX domain-containing protein [Shimazuella soli]
MDNEIIDIFNDQHEYIGQATKKEAHENGWWHRVFTCIVINSEKKTMVLQKKAPERYSFQRPDYLDIAVGGHYQMGEKIEDGIREIKEELGIDVSFERLIPLGVRQTVASITPNYINKEFQHIFLLVENRLLFEYPLRSFEVNGLVELPIEKGIQLLLGKSNQLKGSGIFQKQRKIVEVELTRSDFVPSYLKTDQFMLRIFIVAHRYLKGEDLSLLFW